jgi:hypothetical protein
MSGRKSEKLTAEQISLGSRYLAMSNMAMLGAGRENVAIRDKAGLEQVLRRAEDAAVCGFMESGPDGYDESLEGEAEAGVRGEVESWAKLLKKGDKYSVGVLKKELPFLFEGGRDE